MSQVLHSFKGRDTTSTCSALEGARELHCLYTRLQVAANVLTLEGRGCELYDESVAEPCGGVGAGTSNNLCQKWTSLPLLKRRAPLFGCLVFFHFGCFLLV